MTLALQVLAYNGSRYLPGLFASLAAQTDRDWKLFVHENSGAGEERTKTKRVMEQWKGRLPITYTESVENLGFAGGHQFLFASQDADLVLLVNQDCVLEPRYIATLRAVFADPAVAAAEGKILRWDEGEKGEAVKSDVVDTLGLTRTRWHAVRDLNSSPQILSSQGGEGGTIPVFGVSGCLPMYRRSAVVATDPQGRLFDPAYGSYKEDVDLAYRLTRIGAKTVVAPEAVAYHHRAFRPGAHETVSPYRAFLSYRNHLWNLIGNLSTADWLRDGVFVFGYELVKAGYHVLRHPSFVWRAFTETKRQWPALMEKRAFWAKAPRVPDARRPAKAKVDVAIVMVTYNKLISECLPSVRRAMEASSLKTAFVLVDNGSTSFDPDQMAREVPGAIVIRQPNRGFGNGCNRGAAEVDADYYFFLNPDTILFDPQVMETLYAFLRAHPKAGIAAPRLLYPDGTLQETCRRFPPWHVPFLRRTSLAKQGSPKRALDRFLMRDYDHETLRLVDWAQGSALLMDGALFRALGGFDERFFMYYEDVDLCRRAWLSGRPVYYVPSAELTHVYARDSMDGGVLRSLLRRRTAREHFKSWIKYTLRWGAKSMHV